jgi:hypothetical protein
MTDDNVKELKLRKATDDCAKGKGLVGGGNNWGLVIFMIILLLWFM